MKTFCLLPEKAKELRNALKEKDIKIADLLLMTSEARIEIFKKYAGDSAKDINALFESKLVLKNRVQGVKNWANKVGQMGRYDPTKKEKMKAVLEEYKAKQQERIFNPKENETFLSSLAETQMGVNVSREEAKAIFDMTAKLESLKKEFNGVSSDNPEAKIEYGATRRVLENYVEELKGENIPLKEMARERMKEAKQTFSENKAKAVVDLLLDSTKFVSDNSIALVASVDNSFMGRQGLKILFTHPTVWWQGAKNSFIDMAKTMGGKEMMDALMADIYSNPNFLNGKYQKASILPKSEEQFPTSIPERIPGIGRVFKASEVAFKGSAMRMRTGLFDLLTDLAEKNGVDTTEESYLISMGKMINSLTARGQWGKTGEPAIVRLVLWAPKMIKANLDVYTAHGFGAGLDNDFVRKQATNNLIKIIASTAIILFIAKSIKRDSVELDPRSSDFGKIKVGNRRFDITGGASSLITLASRIVPVLWGAAATKSTITGEITPLNTGEFASRTTLDVFIDFLTNKTTPFAGAVVDLLEGQMFSGEKPTIEKELYARAVPISIQNIINLKDNAAAEDVLGVLLDFVGIGSSSYQKKMSPTIEAFRPQFNEIQKLVADGKEEDAKEMLNDLTDKDYEKYQTLKFYPTYEKLQQFKMDGKEEEGKVLLDSLTDEEYKIYKSLNKKEADAAKKKAENDFFGIVSNYVKAFQTDPDNAWKALTTKEELGIVKGNLVEMKRFYGIKFSDKGGSEEYKKKRMEEMGIPLSEIKNYKLEHIVPVKAGGDTSDENLIPINNAEHDFYTPVDILMAKTIQEGKITRSEIEKLAKDFKINKTITAEDVVDILREKRNS